MGARADCYSAAIRAAAGSKESALVGSASTRESLELNAKIYGITRQSLLCRTAGEMTELLAVKDKLDVKRARAFAGGADEDGVDRVTAATSRKSCSSTSPPLGWTWFHKRRCGNFCASIMRKRQYDDSADEPLHGGHPGVTAAWGDHH